MRKYDYDKVRDLDSPSAHEVARVLGCPLASAYRILRALGLEKSIGRQQAERDRRRERFLKWARATTFAVCGAARKFKVSRYTIYRWIKEFGLTDRIAPTPRYIRLTTLQYARRKARMAELLTESPDLSHAALARMLCVTPATVSRWRRNG